MSNLFIENNRLRFKVEKLLSTSTTLNEPSKKVENYDDDDDDTNASDSKDESDSDSDINNDFDERSETSSSSSESTSDLHDEISIFNDDRKVHYLGKNSATVQYEFNLCDGNIDVTKNYQVHLCGYHVNETGFHPFLEYAMVLKNGIVGFPSFPFHCYSNIPVEDDEEYYPEHVYFKNECMKQIATLLNIYDHNEHSTTSISEMYKGFLLKETPTMDQNKTQNNVYAFFDFTGFSLLPPLEKNQKHIWTTLDEIIRVQYTFAFTIDPTIVTLFEENEELCELRDEKNNILKIPRIMYLCEKAGSSYKNGFRTNLAEPGEMEDMGEFSILDNRIDHPILGNFYLFSMDPFPTQQSMFLIRRFVGFFVKPLYIVKNLTTAVQMSNFAPSSSEVPMTLGMVIPTLVDYVSKKSVSNGKPVLEEQEESQDITDKNKRVSTTEISEEINPELDMQNKKALEEYQEKKQSEEEENIEDAEVVKKELQELPDLDNTCTYFHETVNGVNTAFWMMKSSLHFTEL